MMGRLIILMLGGAKRVSIAKMIAEACRKRGIEPVMGSYELREDEPIAEVAKVINGLRWSDPGIDSHILETLKSLGDERNDRYALIPFVDGSIEIAARISEVNADIYAPTSDPARSRVLFDKVESADLFEKYRLPVPQTTDAIDPIYPLIAKPRRGSASKGIKIVRSEADMPSDSSNYLLQELIEPADEYTVDCFIGQDGRILAISPRKRSEVTGGEATRTVTIDYPRLKELSEQTIERLGLKGAVTLQWIERKGSGEPLLMEINPRLGGGAVCSVHAGADLPGFIVEEATGIIPRAAEMIQPNVEIARYFQEVVFKAKER